MKQLSRQCVGGRLPWFGKADGQEEVVDPSVRGFQAGIGDMAETPPRLNFGIYAGDILGGVLKFFSLSR